MRKLLFIGALLVATNLYGQGYSVENYSQETAGSVPTVTGQFNSWYGQQGSGSDTAFGCTITNPTCAIHINNSTGGLTIQNPAASVCGTVPNSSGGNSAKILDYSTTLASGSGNQTVLYNIPNTQSSVIQGVTWFCSDIPVTANFGTTFDAVILISVASHISNYTSNGTTQQFDIEGCTGGTGTVCTNVPYTPGTWVQVSFQFVNGGACNDSVAFTDCIRVALSDKNGALIGQMSSGAGGAGPADYITLGNINSVSAPSGRHVQFMNLKLCYEGCTASQFPLLENKTTGADNFNFVASGGTPPWDGIITPKRGTDWRQAGFPGDVLPDASWTQCSLTLSAGSYAGSTITSSLAGCAANSYYALGPGTFTITGQIAFPSTGHVVLRGAGASSTTVNFSGGGGTCTPVTATVCAVSASPNIYGNNSSTTWTAGYTQGTTQVTVGSTSGVTANQTVVWLSTCDTGTSSGFGCVSGTQTDNSGFFVCGAKFLSPNGCSVSGPDNGNFPTNRGQVEGHLVTAIAGSVLTITPPLIGNYISTQTPMAYFSNPIQQIGIENMFINGTSTTGNPVGINFKDADQWWVRGVKLANNFNWGFNCLQCSRGVFRDNYWTNLLATNNPYGIRFATDTFTINENNIVTNVTTPVSHDGSAMGSVDAYNYIPNSPQGGSIGINNSLQAALSYHAQDYWNLTEGNVWSQTDEDGIHGTGSIQTSFREFKTSWWSQPANPISGTFSNAIQHAAFDRYEQNIANVMGTPGFNTSYVTTTCAGSTIINIGCTPSSSIPSDSLSKSTTQEWANYDSVTAAIRFCGNSLDTGWAATCGSASEANAQSAATFPGFVPVIGDTTAGQSGLPASFYLPAKPSWFQSIAFPPIGPDVSGGNVIQCGGALNTVGAFNGVPATHTETGCIAGGTGWAGHVNAIPAMACALNVMGMPPDGSGGVLAFDANTCYTSGSTLAPPTNLKVVPLNKPGD